MKLLVFAHTPPPHHGQSYMVGTMLEEVGRECIEAVSEVFHTESGSIHCNHVLAGRSGSGFGELLLIVPRCMGLILHKLVRGANVLCYTPSSGGYFRLFRDWVVMLLCRPFFKGLILYWREPVLAEWLESCTSIRTRALSYHLFKHAEISLVKSSKLSADAEKFYPLRILIAKGQ